MKFWYKRYGSGVPRPIIPIEITYQDRSISYEVLVDSGADLCIFDAQIGELLGISVASGKREWVSGLTGVLEPYYLHPVSITVGAHRFPITAGFLPNIARLGYGVVGQRGFFDAFIVKFDGLKGEIELKERI